MQARLTAVFKRYGAVTALDGVDLTVKPGEWLAVMGPSGCGKSTLLNLLAGIDRPDAGDVEVAGLPLARLSERELTRLRREQIGFVFQFFHLLPTLTALENVALPLALQGVADREADKRAQILLDDLGIGDQRGKYPHEMSGGQMQRVAIARAVIHRPSLVLADEPTGNLDSQSGQAVLMLLRQLVNGQGLTLVMATHSPEAAALADRTLEMRDGRLL